MSVGDDRGDWGTETRGDDHLARIERQFAELDQRVRGIEAWARLAHGYQSLAAPTPSAPESVPLPSTTGPAEEAPSSPPSPQPPVVPVPPDRGPAQQPPFPMPAWSLSDLEQLLSGRVLAWLGGLAILVGAVFFLGLAFTRGWIGPAGRVSIGLFAGVALFTGGAWFFERRERLFGHVLVATGLGTLSMSLGAATRLYRLLPVELGLLGALTIAAVAAVVAIRADSQIVAGYGLVTALAAPPILGAPPSGTTIALLATALAGTTAIALFRSWAWLPTAAFLLSAPQLGWWIAGDAPLAAGLTALAGFGLLHAIAAGGEEFRARRQLLSPTSATLLVANAAFLVAGGFVLLDSGDTARSRGLFLLIVAFAHFLLGAAFLYAEGDRHPFGLLAAGTGVAALTMAIPIRFGGPVVPIAWAAEGAALAWVYAWRTHRFSGGAAIVLGALAIGHLVTFEYPLGFLETGLVGKRPFLNEASGTLGFILLAFTFAGCVVRSWPVRATLTSLGLLLVIYALPFELSGLALLAGWSVLFVLTVALFRLLALVPDERPATERASADERAELALPAGLAAGLALAHALAFELPLWRLIVGLGALPVTPFSDERAPAAAILSVASLLAATLASNPPARRLAVVAAFGPVAYLMPFEFGAATVAVCWSGLALALCLLPRLDRGSARVALGAAAGLLGLALLLTFAVVAPLDRLQVDARSPIDHPPLWSGATAALGSIVVVLLAACWLYRARREARWLATIAGALTVYLLSVGVVDEAQSRVGEGLPLASLQKGAQVALSILWAALGGAAFVVGVVRWVSPLRLAGLALLALATVKVFLYDLASLDATYRVPSFIGLGVLLLASSYAYQRLKPQLAPTEDT